MRLEPTANLDKQQLVTEHHQRVQDVIGHRGLLHSHRRTSDAARTRQRPQLPRRADRGAGSVPAFREDLRHHPPGRCPRRCRGRSRRDRPQLRPDLTALCRLDTARAIVEVTPGHIMTVGVFRNHPVAEILAITDGLGLSTAQLHGDELPDVDHAAAASVATVIKVCAPDLAAIHTLDPPSWRLHRWFDLVACVPRCVGRRASQDPASSVRWVSVGCRSC
ncbi:MAG: hypothetical protein AB7N61_21275 [Acidimicrobiia bacterium]